ncbi:MAG: hypothetical protein M5U09_11100 [Gammaproteobacteria bacterium]|nr:hypothetical protein [Gammaproteobacteria bacterium]
MNDKVYAAAGTLDDVARKLDRGAFFGSIHGTLNHLLVGDRIWMARFTGVASGVAASTRNCSPTSTSSPRSADDWTGSSSTGPGRCPPTTSPVSLSTSA